MPPFAPRFPIRAQTGLFDTMIGLWNNFAALSLAGENWSMRTLGTTLAALGVVAVCAGPAASAPMPVEVVGSWSDQPDCGPTARKMVFDATSLSIVQSDGRKNSVTVDTAGQASDRLEIRVTEVSAGEAENAGAPHVGDMIAVRLENDLLHLLARADSGGSVIEVHNAPALHRCKP